MTKEVTSITQSLPGYLSIGLSFGVWGLPMPKVVKYQKM